MLDYEVLRTAAFWNTDFLFVCFLGWFVCLFADGSVLGFSLHSKGLLLAGVQHLPQI